MLIAIIGENCVGKMLESKHGIYDNLDCNLKLDENYNVDDVLCALSQK